MLRGKLTLESCASPRSTSLPLKAVFPKLWKLAEIQHERFEVTRNGNRVAVLLGADDYDALLETLAILSDSESLVAIRTGLAELKGGDTYGVEEVRNAMVRSGRLRG